MKNIYKVNEEVVKKIAERVYDNGSTVINRNDLEEMFPELKDETKEPKDEKIRQALIKLVTNHASMDLFIEYDIHLYEALTWLEKQGTPAKLSEEEQNRFAKGVLTSCALSFINYLDAHKYEGKMCVSNGECEDIENAFHNAMWDRLHRYYCKYIEKQGISYIKRDVDDAYLKGVTDTKNEIEKQYEKTYQIRKDIATFIFNYRGDIKNRAKWMNYLGIKVSFVETQGEHKETLCDKCKKAQPSHSCQDITALGRCALEKQDELKPADKVEPKFKIGDIVKRKDNPHLTYILKRFTDDGDYEFHAIGKDGNEGCTHFAVVKCQDDWELVEQKPTEWTAEDEKMINSIAVHLNATTCGFPEDRAWADRFMNWLNSIKDRVQPQPKQVWSEEDEAMLENTKEILTRQGFHQIQTNWLKSLKNRVQPQPTWKPSALQMEALESATENCAYSEYQDCLRGLIEHLKKLREQR